jgi:hypothetical protein
MCQKIGGTAVGSLRRILVFSWEAAMPPTPAGNLDATRG